MLILVYTCQNATLLEITCTDSFVSSVWCVRSSGGLVNSINPDQTLLQEQVRLGLPWYICPKMAITMLTCLRNISLKKEE